MTDTATRYREERRKHPFASAADCLRWAKTPDPSEGWEEGRREDTWTREQDGFTIRVRLADQSIFPMPDKHGSTDYGHYVQEAGRYSEDYEWGGEWPRPAELAAFALNVSTPSGPRRRVFSLPYKAIRYSGPGWVQGEKGGYFIPEDIAGTFENFRRRGQSWSVAWDLTREDVEAQISMLFHSPLTNMVVIVEVIREGVVLGDSAMGTDVAGDEQGYIFEMIEEHGMVDDAMEQALARIEALSEAIQ